MIYKYLIIFLAVLSFASNINNAQTKLKQNKTYISKMNEKLDFLAKKIVQKQNILQNLNNKITILNKQIDTLNKKLLNSNKILSNLIDLKKGYQLKAKNIQNQITNFISENYFNTLLKPQNINNLINKEITNKILEKYSEKINNLIKQNRQIIYQINQINKKINKISLQQKELIEKKIQLAKLLKEQKQELNELNKEKLVYKEKLEKLLKKQEFLQNQLAKLKIIKKKKRTFQISENFKPSNNIKVRKVGSIYYRPKIASYYGPKTIPPLKGKIIKYFGSYIDPVYHIRIYNTSITIKPYKQNSVVKAIFNGKIIYIGNNDDKKIIIIKHKHDLFSIYANLSKISPILKKGFYVKKGQIIARVKNTLEFEITYKEYPINPLKVIRLK